MLLVFLVPLQTVLAEKRLPVLMTEAHVSALCLMLLAHHSQLLLPLIEVEVHLALVVSVDGALVVVVTCGAHQCLTATHRHWFAALKHPQ